MLQTWAQLEPAWKGKTWAELDATAGRWLFVEYRLFVPYGATGEQTAINRLEPRYWLSEINTGAAAAVTTSGVDTIIGDFLFRTTGDFGALAWQSFDLYDHAQLSYETRKDYSGLRVRFRWHAVEGVAPLDANYAPSLVLRGRDYDGNAREWVVRLYNYAYGDDLTDCTILLDFDDLYAGWARNAANWEQVDVRDIDSILFGMTAYQPLAVDYAQRVDNVLIVATDGAHGLTVGQDVYLSGVELTDGSTVSGLFTVIVADFPGIFHVANPGANGIGNTGTVIPAYSNDPSYLLLDDVTARVEITLLEVAGTGATLSRTWLDAATHDLRMCTSYGDSYNLTPERIVENLYALGYRKGWCNHYVGYSWWQNVSWSAEESRFVIDTGKPALSVPSANWHADFYARLAAYDLTVISSVAFELLSTTCPLAWVQRDKDGDIGQTGYTPPSYLVSPCSEDGLAYLAGVMAAFAQLAVTADMAPYIQIGEPWWWYGNTSGSVGGGIPCFYDDATRARYAAHFPGAPDMHEFAAITDDPAGHESLLAWLRDQLGASLLSLRAQVRAMIPTAKVAPLPYLPGVLTDAIGIMAVTNWPEADYAYPNFDYFMVEDYEWVSAGAWDLHAQALALPVDTLGYPKELTHYFLGTPQYLPIDGIVRVGNLVTVTSRYELTGWIAVNPGDRLHVTHCDVPALNGFHAVESVALDGMSFTFRTVESGYLTGNTGMFTTWIAAWDNLAEAYRTARAAEIGVLYLWAYPQVMWGDYVAPMSETIRDAITAMLQQGGMAKGSRVLTCDPAWPVGDPPFTADYVRVPAVPANPPRYATSTFSPSVWTDVTGLVSDYRINQDAGAMCDAATLAIGAEWTTTALAQVFREMRALAIQERYTALGHDTGWFNAFWGFSDGYQESWSERGHSLTVQAKDALKLALLNPLGEGAGVLVCEPDKIAIGGYAESERVPLALVRYPATEEDAYEYGLTEGPAGIAASFDAVKLIDNDATFTSRPDIVGMAVTIFTELNVYYQGTITGITSDTELVVDGFGASGVNCRYYIGGIHINWADRPGPQAWCTNARKTNGQPEPEQIPVMVGGDAVQAVFGEGVLRVGKVWAESEHAETSYATGLYIPAGTPPVIVATLHRFAHAAITDRDGVPLASDVRDGLTVIDSQPGQVTLSGNVVSRGLTLVTRDGTGGRYTTVATDTETDTVTFTNDAVSVPVGTRVMYGDANLVPDVIFRLLLLCGYQRSDPSRPLYLEIPEIPRFTGEYRDIALPPLVFKDTDGVAALEAIENLRQQGYLPPNYYVKADENGVIRAQSREQLAADDPAILPIIGIAASPGVDHDRTDSTVVTKVIARGIKRQVTDLLQSGGVTIADVATEDGGLPEPAYAIAGQAVRESPTGNDYLFPLANLITPGAVGDTQEGFKLRPWAWWYTNDTATYENKAQELRAQWRGAVLAEISGISTNEEISVVEIEAPCFWRLNSGDWPGDKEVDVFGGPGYGTVAVKHEWSQTQTIAVDYYDDTQQTWRSLISGITTPTVADRAKETFLRIDADEFDTRGPIRTSRIRLRCVEPFFAIWGDYFRYRAAIGVWLSRLILWTSQEVRGIAELGNAENYNSELSGADYAALRTRLRTRTYILPDAVPWVSNATDAQALAVEWLKDKIRDLAPYHLTALRPDARLWDTVQFTLPTGETVDALLTTVDRQGFGPSGFTAVNYNAPAE
jgi:hypothetical protein